MLARGVYSSSLMPGGRRSRGCDVSGAALLVRAGQRKLIGGQEDHLIDIALEIVAEKA